MTEKNLIFDVVTDEELESRFDAEAEAAYAAGRIVPHAQVVEWLESNLRPAKPSR